MHKIKDFFYDKSDILVALIILGFAAIVIFYRIDAIVEYPAKLAADNGTRINAPDSTEDGSADKVQKTSKNTATKPAISQDNTKQDSKGTNSSKKDTKKVVNYSVYIQPGSNASDIAEILIGAKLIKDKQEFFSAMTTAGAESKLKAGTFIVPSNSTPAEIIKIITK